METKNILIMLGVLVLAGVGVWGVMGYMAPEPVRMDKIVVPPPPVVESAMPVLGSTTSEMVVEGGTPASSEVKEFTMTSYFEMVDGKPKTYFSLKDINVKKGDKVRIKVTNTKGTHDFNIDEYNIDKDTPLDKEVVIEFTADKAGDFVYYCAMPNHRAMGQWGTLHVTE